VALSAELADAIQAEVGDEIEIQSGQALRRFRVVGVAIDNTIFLGGRLAERPLCRARRSVACWAEAIA